METFLRLSVSLLVLGFVSIGCAQPVEEPAAEPTEEELIALARGIHDRVITIDTHDDIPFNFATEEVDPGVRGSRKVDLPKMREGGLDVGFFIVYVGQGDRDAAGYERAKEQAMTKFDAIHRMEEMYPDEIELAHTADDVERIAASGKLVAAIGIENGWVIGKDLSLIEQYQKLGARYVTLAHNGNNDICDSANPRGDEPESEHDGVSEFGVEVIAEMNRVGIMVDVSHISKKSMLDAVRLSQAPVIASHSSTRLRNTRFHVHFTPTSASWLNMVERFFRDLSEQRLRRGVFHSVPELIQAVEEYVGGHNQNPKPFIWTATASDILEKVQRARKKLDKLQSV